jgi:hypothetical protein
VGVRGLVSRISDIVSQDVAELELIVGNGLFNRLNPGEAILIPARACN